MVWLNSCDIDELRVTHPPLVDGVAFLRGFKDLINEISDGWSYWSYGTKCSDDLQELVARRGVAAEAVTWDEVKKAKAKVVRFLRRCKQTKDRTGVLEFLSTWPL